MPPKAVTRFDPKCRGELVWRGSVEFTTIHFATKHTYYPPEGRHDKVTLPRTVPSPKNMASPYATPIPILCVPPYQPYGQQGDARPTRHARDSSSQGLTMGRALASLLPQPVTSYIQAISRTVSLEP